MSNQIQNQHLLPDDRFEPRRSSGLWSGLVSPITILNTEIDNTFKMLPLEFWPEQMVWGSLLLNKRNSKKTAVQRLQQDLTIPTELWQLSTFRSLTNYLQHPNKAWSENNMMPASKWGLQTEFPCLEDQTPVDACGFNPESFIHLHMFHRHTTHCSLVMAGSRHYMCKSGMPLHTRPATPLFVFYHKTAHVTFKTVRQMLSCSSCELIHHRGHNENETKLKLNLTPKVLSAALVLAHSLQLAFSHRSHYRNDQKNQNLSHMHRMMNDGHTFIKVEGLSLTSLSTTQHPFFGSESRLPARKLLENCLKLQYQMS